MASAEDQTGKSGDLTFKQGGVMLVVISAGLVVAEIATKAEWHVGGIPVIYIAAVFGLGGLALAIVGFVKKI